MSEDPIMRLQGEHRAGLFQTSATLGSWSRRRRAWCRPGVCPAPDARATSLIIVTYQPRHSAEERSFECQVAVRQGSGRMRRGHAENARIRTATLIGIPPESASAATVYMPRLKPRDQRP